MNRFPLKSEDVVMRIKCDIHPWMVAYVGVVPHPYFAVSGTDGSFTHRARARRTPHDPDVARAIRTPDTDRGRKGGPDGDRRFRLHGKEKPSPPPDVRDLVIPGDAAGDHADCRTLTRAGCANAANFPRRNRHAITSEVRLSARPPRLRPIISGYHAQRV